MYDQDKYNNSRQEDEEEGENDHDDDDMFELFQWSATKQETLAILVERSKLMEDTKRQKLKTKEKFKGVMSLFQVLTAEELEIMEHEQQEKQKEKQKQREDDENENDDDDNPAQKDEIETENDDKEEEDMIHKSKSKQNNVKHETVQKRTKSPPRTPRDTPAPENDSKSTRSRSRSPRPRSPRQASSPAIQRQKPANFEKQHSTTFGKNNTVHMASSSVVELRVPIKQRSATFNAISMGTSTKKKFATTLSSSYEVDDTQSTTGTHSIRSEQTFSTASGFSVAASSEATSTAENSRSPPESKKQKKKKRTKKMQKKKSSKKSYHDDDLDEEKSGHRHRHRHGHRSNTSSPVRHEDDTVGTATSTDDNDKPGSLFEPIEQEQHTKTTCRASFQSSATASTTKDGHHHHKRRIKKSKSTRQGTSPKKQRSLVGDTSAHYFSSDSGEALSDGDFDLDDFLAKPESTVLHLSFHNTEL